MPRDVSNFNSYERRYGGQEMKGRKIVIYRHTAFGDQLMMTAITRYIKTQNPDAYISYVMGSKTACIWDNNRDADVVLGAMTFESIKQFDYHLFYENMLESNSQPEQNNAYDDLFAFGGMLDVPPEFKRPAVYLGEADEAMDEEWRSSSYGRDDYILYHWSSANKVRQYPADLADKFFRKWTKTKIVVVGDGKEKIPGYPHVINMVSKTPTFRHLIPLVRRAKVVVCPDSSVGHLAAAWDDIPVIGLWGPFHPDDRVKYYANHTPILGDCPHGPCRTHQFSPPQHLCKDVGAQYVRPNNCAALSTISPDLICSEVEKKLA